MINELLENLKEDLKEINEKINDYESRTYTIKNISSIMDDSREYNRLLGEKENIKLMMFRLKNRS